MVRCAFVSFYSFPLLHADSGSPSSVPGVSAGMHSMSEWDWTGMAEKDFNDLCIYHVPDKPVDKTVDNMAIASLPRNLYLRPSGEIPKVRVCA